MTLSRPAEPSSPALADGSADAEVLEAVGVLKEASDVDPWVADTSGVTESSGVADTSGVAESSLAAGMSGEVEFSREEEAAVEVARSSRVTAGVVEELEVVRASEEVNVLMESPVIGLASAVGKVVGAVLAAERI